MSLTPQHASAPPSQASLQERLHTLNAISSAEASTLAVQGKQATATTLVIAPFLAFLRVYFGQGEWRHGISGFISAILSAYGILLSYTKLWEQQHVKTTTPPPSQP